MAELIIPFDPKLGDDVSEMLYEAARQSYNNRPGAVVEIHPTFSGKRGIHPDHQPRGCINALCPDGIGTKVYVAERMRDHSTMAFDLFAMAVDDAAAMGAESISITTILDVNRLGTKLSDEAIRGIATGYVAAASLAKVVILNGETAALGERVGGYGSFNYNWCAVASAYVPFERVLGGEKVKVGDRLIGLAQKDGFRSNGITDVRTTLEREFGDNWHKQIVGHLGSASLGRLVLEPSTIFTRFITSLTGGYDLKREPIADISAIAHITGGGLPGKLARMLQVSGLGAEINNGQSPPDIMRFVQELSGFSDKEAYRSWHMGSGMVIATPESEKVLAEAKAQGIDAQVIGQVTDEPGIKIKNRGAVQDEEWVKF